MHQSSRQLPVIYDAPGFLQSICCMYLQLENNDWTELNQDGFIHLCSCCVKASQNYFWLVAYVNVVYMNLFVYVGSGIIENIPYT